MLAALKDETLLLVAIGATVLAYVFEHALLGGGQTLALVAAGLALWAPLAWWTLYNGLIAYLLMGLLFAAEWLVRQRVRGRT